MTSLQKQLAVIAATSTHQLDLKAQKIAHGKSLLFEPKVAASQSFESLYLICHDGFRELCALDQRFVPFSATLFSEQSKAEDRTQMSTKENNALDAVVEAFLTLVGPRLLLKPAVKAVEWLIRRFRVHEYNTELVVLTFLPYHSTPIFQALLSILPANIPQSCRFLAPYVGSLDNPPRRTIVYTAANTPAFFSAFQEYALKVLKRSHHASHFLSFWAGVTTQAVDSILDSAGSGRRAVQDQRIEEVLLRILPVLNECLKLSEIPEALMGCYMIIISLVTKSSFEDKVLDTLMEAVSRTQEARTLDSRLICLAVIAEERSEVSLPTRVARSLLKVPNLAQKLVSASQRCRAERLTLGCALAAIELFGASTPVHDRRIFLKHVIDSQLLTNAQLSLLSATATRLSKEIDIASDHGASWKGLVDEVSELAGDSIQPSAAEQNGVESDDEDVVMEDLDDKDSIEPLPSLPSIEESSYLDTHPSRTFDDAASAFVRAVTVSHRIKAFLDLPELQRQEADKKPLFLSFLVRIWCGPYPVSVREACLRSTAAFLKERSGNGDFHLLIPYLLYALADESLPVRRSAADCIVSLSKSGKRASSKSAWGSTGLHGKDSSNISPLQSDLASKLLSILTANLEECTMDPKYVSTILNGMLGGSALLTTGGLSDLKSSHRTSFMTFFSTTAATTPLLSVRLFFFSVFDFTTKHISGIRIEKLLPAVRQWCLLSRQDVSTRCEREKLDVLDADRGNLCVLLPKEPESVELLKYVVCGNINQDRKRLVEAGFERLQRIWPSLKGELRLDLATRLLDLSLEDGDSTNEVEELCRIQARETLRSVKLPGLVLEAFIQSVWKSSRMLDSPPASKRRRTSHSGMARVDVLSPEETARTLRRLTLVLELVEASNPGQYPELFKGLFVVLAQLHQFKQQSGSSLVYLQSMILGSLLPIANTLKDAKDASEYKAAIRVDLLIDCIRSSSSPQVQNASLLLIASLASWEPELVLHNLMPIFTFIGTTLLRQKDDYSAHVVDQTISRVVPQLAASLRTRNKNFLAGVADLIFSFTAAFEHIPQQRRLKLFTQLARTLEPQDSLSAIVAILVDKYPESADQKKFVCELLKEFEPMVVLHILQGYLELVRDAARPKRTVSDVLFGLNEKQAGHIDTSIGNLLSSFVEITKNESLQRHIHKAFRNKQETADPRPLFASMMETTVHVSQQVADKPSLYEACSKVLSSCLDLLPTTDLVKSAEILSTNPDAHVRAAAIKAIEVRTEKTQQSDAAAVSALLSFLAKIEELVEGSEEITVKLVALSCVDQIIERFGKKDTSAVISIARVVSGTECLASDDDRLRILSLVCLASIVHVVDEEFIALLPTVLPLVFKYLAESIQSGDQADLYNAIYTLLCSIVESLGYMFTADHIEQALRLSLQSSASQLGEECDQSRNQFYQAMAKHLEARNIFASIKKTWSTALSESTEAVQEELDLLHLTIESQTKPKMVKACSGAFSLFLEVFDIRSQALSGSQVALGALDRLERTINQAVLSMTLKLTDATFRPFFVQLVDWLSGAKKSRMQRATTFYSFLSEFFEKFKSIVTHYANDILEQASKMLEELSSTEKYPDLRRNLLDALRNSFQHDQDGFWQAPTHFSAILNPLIQQLRLPDLEAVSQSVIPTITELAVSASSHDNHKEMNQLVLRLMRAEEAHTRLAAVKCEQSLTKRLGEEWLGLLAEMLPIISELREDDDEMVERETQRWINDMEAILGEDLEGMLS